MKPENTERIGRAGACLILIAILTFIFWLAGMDFGERHPALALYWVLVFLVGANIFRQPFKPDPECAGITKLAEIGRRYSKGGEVFMNEKTRALLEEKHLVWNGRDGEYVGGLKIQIDDKLPLWEFRA